MEGFMEVCERKEQVLYTCSVGRGGAEENDCYFFTLIQLMGWCQENCAEFKTRSTLKHVILELRRNNLLARPITIYSVLLEAVAGVESDWQHIDVNNP
jgi:hypothetical protein